jgi:hypothetical protein
LANRLRTAETPNPAAQGQSVSRKTAAEVPLIGLSPLVRAVVVGVPLHHLPWKPKHLQRNAAAAAIMDKHGVAIDDLFIFITPQFAEVHSPNDVHFSGKGSEMLGQQVAEAVMAAAKEP